MISPEMLRFYPFFGAFDADQRKDIAMISEEITAAKGETIYKKGEPGKGLFVILEGHVDILDRITSEHDPDYAKEYLIGEMQPGSILGIGALVDPFTMNTTARCVTPCRLIRIDVGEILALAEKDNRLGYLLMQAVLKLIMEQLNSLRGMMGALMAES